MPLLDRAAHQQGMPTTPSTTEPREVVLTDRSRAAIAAVCGLRADRIVAVYENVAVRTPAWERTDFLGNVIATGPAGDPYPTVEVISRRPSGAVTATRYRAVTVKALLADANPARRAS